MFGAIAGGIASALAGGAMSKLFGGGQKAASGGIQGDVLATDNNTVGMGDAGIKSAIQGSNVPFFFSSRRRHTRCLSDWSSDVCSSDLSTNMVWTPLKHNGLLHSPKRRVAREGIYRFCAASFASRQEGGGHASRLSLLCTRREIGRASCRGKSVEHVGRRVVRDDREVTR